MSKYLNMPLFNAIDNKICDTLKRDDVALDTYFYVTQDVAEGDCFALLRAIHKMGMKVNVGELMREIKDSQVSTPLSVEMQRVAVILKRGKA